MKNALSIIVTVFLVVAFATTGVFADDNVYVTLPSVTSPPSASDLSSDGLLVFTSSGYSYSAYFGGSLANTEPVILGIVNEGNSAYLYFGSQQQNAVAYYNNVAGTVLSRTCSGYSSYAPNAYWVNSNLNLNSYSDRVMQVNLPSFNSAVEFGQYVASYSSVVGEVIPFTLTPGYALVINGPCEVSDRTYTISGSWNFDRLANSRINGSFERLVQTNNLIDGFSPDRYLTVEQLLPWWADNSNVVGVASNYSYHNTDVITLSDGGVNYVLGYPLYYQGSGDYSVSHENAVSLSGSIYIQYSGTRPIISKIALESIADIVEGHYHYYNVFRPDVYDETGEVVSDGSGGTVVEFPDAPVGGGNSGQPPVNEETNLFGVLSKFVNDIKNLISQGSHAISELVNYGSSFMHSIAQMYDWLPATLTTLIVTAFSIVLVIGVIKLLWK